MRKKTRFFKKPNITHNKSIEDVCAFILENKDIDFDNAPDLIKCKLHRDEYIKLREFVLANGNVVSLKFQ